MEWAAAIGVASGIFSFATFAHESFRVLREVMEKGSTKEHRQCATLAGDMNQVLGRIRARATIEGSDHAKALESIATETEKYGLQLMNIFNELLKKLEADPTVAFQSANLNKKADAVLSTARKAKVAAWTLMKKGDIDELERRITRNRNQLMFRMQELLVERQFAIKVELDSLRTDSRRQNDNIRDQLRLLNLTVQKSSPIINHETQTNHVVPETKQTSSEVDLSLQKKLESMKAALKSLLRGSKRPSPEMRILKRLFFSQIYSRRRQVVSAEVGTYEWILNDSGDVSSSTDPVRSSARSRLLKWLRHDNGIFHLTGKPGSGKSTLMKLLMEHPRTREELRHWAKGRVLIFSCFFFWRAGEEIQNSLVGLHRSILFETLLQCPELIPKVFPEAYEKFETTSAEDCIEELYFQPENIETAFSALISEKLPAEYRVCFLIDGLDEYGEDGRDRLDHEILAKKLTFWASNDNVKILASSRPHTAFNEEFLESRRIRLHEITAPDIHIFCQNMFLSHKNFPLVEDYYLDLVQRVVENADGVFLWARIVVHQLRAAITSRRGFASMLQLLESLPKELSELYEGLLASLPPSDRLVASKLLLVIAKKRDPLSALAVSWIDEWENASFPMSWDMVAYSKAQVQQKIDDAEVQLDGLTKGLVELDREFGKLPIYGHTVKLYHRTVRDYILHNKSIQSVAKDHSFLENGEVHLRIGLGLYWFSEAHRRRLYVARTNIHLSKEWSIPPSLLPGFETIMVQDNNGIPDFPARYISLSPWRERDKHPEFPAISFNHWAAWASDQPLHILDTAACERKASSIQSTGLSFLLASALGGRVSNVKTLLRRGFSPHLKVPLYRDSSGMEIVGSGTVWMIFCIVLATAALNETTRPADFLVLEQMLSAVGRKSDIFFLLSTIPKHIDLTHRHCTIAALEPTHVLSLRRLVIHCNPPNLTRLLEILDASGDETEGWGAYLSGIPEFFSAPLALFAPSSKPKLPSLEDYSPFDFGIGERNRPKYVVHSMRWGRELLSAFVADGHLGCETHARMF